MRVACIGAGPGGLYAAILLKQANPRWQISVYERNPAHTTYGWGVVFSQATLQKLATADPTSHATLSSALHPWDELAVHYKGQAYRSAGHGFFAIGRARMLSILQERAAALDVHLHFETSVEDVGELADADLIIAADGINSRIREQHADHFQPTITDGTCKYIWLGTSRPFDAFTFAFQQTEWGWFQVHAYQFDDETSTVIIETTNDNWHAAGFDQCSEAESIAVCEDQFADLLAGHSLRSKTPPDQNGWINFRGVRNEGWVLDNLVLLGDAAHTTHFSIGSGTRLALEDAIGLQEALRDHAHLPEALARYAEARKVASSKLQRIADVSRAWFENVAAYGDFAGEQFTYSLLTRSLRISHENLRLRDRDWLENYEGWFSGKASPTLPADVPLTIQELTLPNRVVAAPPVSTQALDQITPEELLAAYEEAAFAGAGMIYTPLMRLDSMNEETAYLWQSVIGILRERHGVAVALQAHPADFPVPFNDAETIPQAQLLVSYIKVGGWAAGVGFDLVEIPVWHPDHLQLPWVPSPEPPGDHFFMLAVAALRSGWKEKPLSVRLLFRDEAARNEMALLTRQLHDAKIDAVHIAPGEYPRVASSGRGKMAMVPLADQIRNAANLLTIVSGNITTHDQINTIVAAGRADLCVLDPS